MDQTVKSAAANEAASERHRRILEAAARCFARTGFHRTTMQDVAAEAGMSPGNLYRYFPSKDAMVAGLVERDRAEIARDFAQMDGTADFMAGFRALGRKYFEEQPREKSVICLEIWAEATRSPHISALNCEVDQDIIMRLADLFSAGQAQGAVAAGVDAQAAARLVATLSNGLFCRRALAPDFNPEPEVGAVFAVIEAVLTGRVALGAPAAQKDQAS